ncbi:MAG TPA: hypothetical protein VFG19_04445 [Geobacteraceae bacterium]|nr:hypothetical protein [Geobacteraceae bacterium]
MIRKHVKQAGYEPTYWNGKGKYQKEYEDLRARLVPPTGRAESTEGEVLRCIGKFYNERYKNGHRYPVLAEAKYATVFLRMHGWDGMSVNISMWDSELDRVVDFIIEKILESEAKGS